MCLVPAVAGTGYASRQLGFTPEERRSRLRLYASPDGRAGSIPIYSGACIYAGLFTEGDRVRHTVEPGRGAWVQVVSGWGRAGGVALGAGDGGGITGAGVVELDFLASTELLLLDLEMEEPSPGD
jgi:redox-sensitive bicupin YhaK (pirin superfamily)